MGETNLKDQNNIQNMMDENLKKQLVSSNAQIKKTQKQLERQQKIKLKEFEISEPEAFKKAKILSRKLNIEISNFIGCDLSDYDENGNLISEKKGIGVESFQKAQKETLSQGIENLQVVDGVNTKSENQGREKTLDNQTENQNEKKVEKIDLSEIQKLKEEISPTEKKVEPEKTSSNVKKIDPEELKKLKEQISSEEKPERQQESQETQKEEEKESQTARDNSESLENQPDEKTQTDANLETEQNQPIDNQNQSDAGQVVSQKQTAENNIEKTTSNEQTSEFQGMSEEEISAELERRKRLADLKLKYSEEKKENEVGEYKKNLDFSSNSNIKHFKMRPPKKILIIILSVVFAFVAVAVSLTIYFVKKPPAPASLVNSKISQSTIYHYVGEKIDLTGITIEQLYSDGSKKSVPVDVTKISQRSSNIGSDLTILEFGENSFLEFTVDEKKHKLNINLNELRITGIKEIIHPTEEYSSKSKINFDSILILVNIKDRENNDFEPKRISSKNATFKIEGQVENLLTDEEGILLYRFDESSNIVTLPEGNYNIVVTIEEKGTTFSASFSIQIFDIE